MTTGRFFMFFDRKNKEKPQKNRKKHVYAHRKCMGKVCSSQIMRKFAAICNAHFAKWRIL